MYRRQNEWRERRDDNSHVHRFQRILAHSALACIKDGIPASVRPIVERCLRKDFKKRWQAIGDVRIAIEEAGTEVPRQAEGPPHTKLLWPGVPPARFGPAVFPPETRTLGGRAGLLLTVRRIPARSILTLPACALP